MRDERIEIGPKLAPLFMEQLARDAAVRRYVTRKRAHVMPSLEHVCGKVFFKPLIMEQLARDAAVRRYVTLRGRARTRAYVMPSLEHVCF